ncbi:hypothetical protein EJ04DRAFT_556513 [Polyplosphaeria fusca]|uniref:Rhodopsin domain-containing protein n=1 Tax=Polyplosphaeria fusca TaxID=682080 RepID=A0A9P4UW09_9PLEO|nr:hypothetical protein EJ04DRAFT_556513 [Polyplosphaeria fusca]
MPALWDKMSPEGQRQMIILIVRFVIITVALGFRFVGKFTREQKNRIWWDDFWIIMAWCLNAGAESLTVWGFVKSHGGMALPALIKGHDMKAAQAYLIGEDFGSMLWHGSITCILLSVLCFYLTIFQFETNFRFYIYGLFTLSVMWGIASMLSGILLCIPPSNFWKLKDLDKCGSYNEYLLAVSVSELIITTAILALPVRPVLKLNLDLRTRLSILGVFFLGAFVLVSAIIRIALVYRPHVQTPNYYQLLIWSTVHMTSAYVCACLPVCKPVWLRLVKTSKSVYDYSRSFTRRLRSRGSNSGNDRSPSPSSGGSRSQIHKEKSYPDPKPSTVNQNEVTGDAMLDEYGKWSSGDWRTDQSRQV